MKQRNQARMAICEPGVSNTITKYRFSDHFIGPD